MQDSVKDNDAATKTSVEDVDIEVAESSDTSTETTGEHDREQRPNSFYKRPKLLALMVLAVIIVVIVALIPTVFLKKDGLSGPHFALSAEITGPSNTVRLANSGTRMFINPYHDDGIIEVLDWENGNWVSKSKLIPHIRNGGRRLHDGDSVTSFEVSDDGSRVLAIVKEKQENMYPRRSVRVFEENTNGTEWVQVGESLDSELLGSLGTFAPHRYPCRNGISRQEELRGQFLVDSISFSSDGNTFLVVDHFLGYKYKDCGNNTVYESVAGGMQAFQHKDTVSEERRQEFANSTWIPKGQMLLGGSSVDRRKNWSRHAVMSGNGMRIVAGHDEFRVLDYDASLNQWNDARVSSNYIFNPKSVRDDIFAISYDGKVIAVAEADYSPSAYLENPYQGKVTLYTEQGLTDYGSLKFEKFWLHGEEGFEHFGSSIALSQDFLVVGSDNSGGRRGEERFPDGDKIHVFMKNATEGWNSVGPVLGHPVIERGWKSVAISPDGKRIAGVGYQNYDEKSVLVFDFQDE